MIAKSKKIIACLAACFALAVSMSMTAVAFAAEGVDGSVSVKSTISEVAAGDTVELTFAVDAKTDPVGAINFHVDLPDGVEYVSHQVLVSSSDFMFSSYTPDTGAFGCGATANGKTGAFDVLKVTVKVADEASGSLEISAVPDNNYKLDGRTKMDFGSGSSLVLNVASGDNTGDGDNQGGSGDEGDGSDGTQDGSGDEGTQDGTGDEGTGNEGDSSDDTQSGVTDGDESDSATDGDKSDSAAADSSKSDSATSSKSNLSQTGDATMVVAAGLGCLALIAAAGVVVARKKGLIG